MKYALLGQKKLYFFEALNEKEGRRIAEQILAWEKWSALIGCPLTWFGDKKQSWEAIAVDFPDEIATKKVIWMKRVKRYEPDAIYLTRLQEERGGFTNINRRATSKDSR